MGGCESKEYDEKIWVYTLSVLFTPAQSILKVFYGQPLIENT